MSGLSRQVAFGRRIPLRQIGRRLWLALRRRAERRLRPSLAVAGLQRADAPPLPLFAARACAARRTDAGWTFRFLGREAAMGETVDWSGADRSPASQLWRMNLHYMEYLEAFDDEGFAELVAQWIAGNPPYAPGATGDGWNAYALSLRVLVWMQQLAARAGRLPPVFAAAAERSIAAQLAYLERHLETDIGGNHLMNACVVRLANNYGPRSNIKSPDFGFINYFIGLALQDKDVPVYGEGGQLRTMTYVDDSVDALILAASGAVKGQTLFACDERQYTVRELAETIVEVVGRGKVRFVPWPRDREAIEIGDAVITSKRLRDTLGWQATTALVDGLAKTRDYFLPCLTQYTK